MDPKKHMIIAKGKICTQNVLSVNNNTITKKIDIVFKNGSRYSYSKNNVIVMNNPILLDPQDYIVETPDGKRLYDIKGIYQFEYARVKYWHIELKGFDLDYRKDDLQIIKNCLTETRSSNVFDYLKEISNLSEIPNDYGEIILHKYYEQIGFISENTALSVYLNPKKRLNKYTISNYIFPFGCNQSQFKAVKNALDNQISVIQGPPGTGKTQTILNIIANLLINNKSVIVVSNNNSAIGNIIEKLSNEKIRMDFLVAFLGSAENKNAFIDSQSGRYPDLYSWIKDNDENDSKGSIFGIAQRLQNFYRIREEISRRKEEKYEIELEMRHFNEYADVTMSSYDNIRFLRKPKSEKIMRLWHEIQHISDLGKKISLLYKIKLFLGYGIVDRLFYKQDLQIIITILQRLYYEQSLKELTEELCLLEKKLAEDNVVSEKELEERSLAYLKRYIKNKYDWEKPRHIFTNDDLYKHSKSVLEEYPIVLSTTFSARSSLNCDDVEYDYVIMDEASQVDIATGALALSCAQNAVIVGDLKQLPNVISHDVRQKADMIRNRYNIDDTYDFASNSFLQSVVNTIPNVPSTLLREHYRCNPRIISFCNQKFYNGELVIMTEDDGNNNVLTAVKTVEGNHARDNYNQRQIDIIKNEILPTLDVPREEIGIIAPYNNQVNALREQIPEIEAATVHKFQGREKDVIILSTVDNQIKDFTDDPYMLNVAVSRAKKRLIVIVSGNKHENKGNVVDLISYIQYNKMEVINSKTYSIFDYLYSQYREQRWMLLKKHKKISEYDSENLTYLMLADIIKEYPEYGIQCFVPLSMIVRDLSILSEDEIKYALNPATHLDFIIFDKFSKQPIATIETDGYSYHKKGTRQHDRDKLKDHIIEQIGLKMIRLNTTGSNEKEKVLQILGL